jgi:ATP-dependent Clp protease ATP-binding subunit ClpC
MTSNIGAAIISKNAPLGFSQASETGIGYEDMKSRITSELKKLFRPEFLNRVDEVIVFHKLDRDEIRRIVDLLIGKLQKQISPSGITIQLTDEGRDLLVDKGFDPTLGARPLRRAIQRYIEDKLADAMLERQFPEGTVVVVDAKDDDTLLTVNGEPVGGSVELPLVGVDEPSLGGSVASGSGASLAEVPGEAV